MNDPIPSDNRPPRRGWPANWLWRFIAWFLDRLYAEWSWGYDLVADLTSVGQWWHWQEAAIPALPDGRLLELGFGTGRMIHHLLAEDREVYGLDRSPQMVQRTAALLAESNLKLPLIHGNANHLPLPSESFSGIYATFPSDYFFQDESTLEMWRVLAPEGKVVVVPFAVIRGRGLLDRAAKLLFRITGQAPNGIPTDWLDQVNVPGFKMSYQVVHQSRAKVLQVSLTKVS